MNYKKRLTLLFVGLFFFVITAILSFIYVSYADFRREEFFERLKQKSFTTAKLLAEVKEIDRDLLKIIDRNTINEMYDEKVLVFNEKNELIYSSLDNETIPYSISLIEQIRNNADKYYVDGDGDEVVGVHYTENAYDYVILSSAYDQYGINKLKNLKGLIIGALLAGTVMTAFASYFYIRQVFSPIDQLNKSIQKINENNLREFITVKKHHDELDVLAVNYNQMLARLYKAFELQRSFVRNASHELKTPLALMQTKLETLDNVCTNVKSRAIISSLMGDIVGQASLVESLLLIQRLQSEWPIQKSAVRVDEILDSVVKEVRETYPHFDVEMDIGEGILTDNQLTVLANPMLLKIGFKNLVVNAALHSNEQDLRIMLQSREGSLNVAFANTGETELPMQIFEPFYRLKKEHEKAGSGLGLSIVEQIVESLMGSIKYAFRQNRHIFTLTISHL